MSEAPAEKKEPDILELSTPATFCLCNIGGVKEMRISFGEGRQVRFALSRDQIRLGAVEFTKALAQEDEGR